MPRKPITLAQIDKMVPFAAGCWKVAIRKQQPHSKAKHTIKKLLHLRIPRKIEPIQNYPRNRIFYHRGEVMKYEEAFISKGILEFYQFKILHELFPKNIPNVHGVEEVVDHENKPYGYLLHMEEVKTNPELDRFMGQRMLHSEPKWLSTRHAKKVYKNKVIKEKTKEFFDWGINTKEGGLNRGNPFNVSIANPKEPVFFEPKIANIEKFEKKIKSTNLPKQKLDKILRYYERYLKAKEKFETQ